ncbi:FUSC family protein [Galbibacter sp. EGI 63066]|uniref:FUSC family protein n=1 Tax=Galbibacter sp. EGI 63066 TaxID=2993559 RepID=UPI00224878B2|nr:FUSC family membrane protein [Galbibacter sp. EGI 63066]MCX2679561.1 FUSC family protein [Galbibacter sp. EGI 63066]
MKNNILQFFKSYRFTKGLLISTAAFSAITFCYFFLNMVIGAGMAFGVLLASTSDIPGRKKHHIYGVLIAILLAVVSFVCIQFTLTNLYLLFPTLIILVFFNSYISVYGFRASLIAFSGLLAISLSFAKPQSGIDILYNVLYIIGGGLWYLLFSSLFESMRTKQYSDELLTECIQLTAEYLNTRVASLSSKDRESALNRQLSLQNEINEKHETLRSMLLHKRQRSGSMKYQRQQLLIFIELVDILEFAVANAVNYKKFDKSSALFQETTLQIASSMQAVTNRLSDFSEYIMTHKRIPEDNELNTQLRSSLNAIEQFKSQIDIKEKREEVLLLRNLYDYTERQLQKVITLERIINNNLINEITILKRADRNKFITSQDYSFKVFRENLTLKSPIFKHSLRLVVTVLIGYGIGTVFSLQNTYWILLTVMVIMRPGYVLTKERSRQRMIGTLIGGAIALGVVLITNQLLVYIIITFIAMTLAFTFIQQNYKASAVFITLTIIFVYAMLSPNAFEIIQYRMVDTLIGAGLASITNLLLWPAWESQQISELILEAAQTNRRYLHQVNVMYHNKSTDKLPYKISRKNAFIAIGNLHAGFQRMTQEPKSKQQNLNSLYEIVVTQNTLLSATASLGTYIQIHPTTDASAYFDTFMTSIDNELAHCEAILSRTKPKLKETPDLKEAKAYLHHVFDQLSTQRNLEIDTGQEINTELREHMKEVRIISEQLEWLYSLSKNLHTAVKMYQ